MKFILYIALLIIATQSYTAIKYNDDVDTSSLWQDKPYTQKCISDSIQEFKNLVKLGKDIASGAYVVVPKDVIDSVKGAIKLILDCKALFCYGPTFKKCEAQNPIGCEKYGAVVYPKCKDGFTNFGCCVCATECPEDFTDNGLYCLKPQAYGRGSGYVEWKRLQCEKENPQGCEKNGAMWYPKCQKGFHPVGCCICSPDCPSNWTDIGISCKKPESYGRGVGYPVTIGEQCVKEIIPSQVNCDELRSKVQLFTSTVDIKLQQNMKRKVDDRFEDATVDNVRHLSELMDVYAEKCLDSTIE